MTSITADRLYGSQLLAVAIVAGGALLGNDAVVALGVLAFFVALGVLAVATTTDLVVGVHRGIDDSVATPVADE